MFEQIFKLYENLDYFGKTLFILTFITITANTLGVILMTINSVSKRKYKTSVEDNEVYVINKTKDILNYIIKNYSLPNDLTVSRLTQLIYLIDWEMVKSITNK